MEQAKQTIEPAGAPKITPEHIASQVVGVAYHRFPGTTVTVCCVTLRNGYNTIGHSACVSPENFDAAIGEQIAYKNALNEIWQLEGYLLAEWLWLARNPQTFLPATPEENVNRRKAEIEDSNRGLKGGWPGAEGLGLPTYGSLGEPVADQPKFESGGGGEYAGAGASESWEQPATPEPLREPVSYVPDVNPVDAGSNGCSASDFSAPASVDSSLSSSGSDYSI